MEIRALVGGAAITCRPETTLAEAARLMETNSIGSLAVTQAEGLVGILTDRDVVRAAAAEEDAGAVTVAAWMTPDPDTIEPDVSVAEAAAWMLATGFRHLPVMDGPELLGIASIKDVLWAIAAPQLAGEDEDPTA